MIPEQVQQWLKARSDYEERLAQGDLSGPRALPVVRIRDQWYFEDSRMRRYRNIVDLSDFIDM